MAGATIETVFSMVDCNNTDHQRIIGFGNGNGNTNGWLTVRTLLDALTLSVRFSGNPERTGIHAVDEGDRCPVLTRSILHFIVDTLNPTPTERLQVYIDGRRLSVEFLTDSTWPLLGATIDLGAPPRTAHIGRAHSPTFDPLPVDVRTANSSIYFAAVYSHALSAADVASRVVELSASDDH